MPLNYLKRCYIYVNLETVMVLKFMMNKLKRMILKPFRMKKRATKQQQVLPKALREQVWLKVFGKTFSNTCYTTWCSNKITPFDFHIGHNIPISKGWKNSIDNLFPICSRCNLSMNNRYTIGKWGYDFV